MSTRLLPVAGCCLAWIAMVVIGGAGAAADTPDAVTPDAVEDIEPERQSGPPSPLAARAKAAAAGGPNSDLPKFDVVAKGYEKVVAGADGRRGLYTLWTRKKDAQVLAELPRNFQSQTLFLAYTIAGGTLTAGVQTGDMYVTWKRYDKRLALIRPNFAVRTTGDLESQRGRDRVFTDSVILDVPIAAMGPGGGPVIDMDALLLGSAGRFFGYAAAGINQRLATIVKAKSFPQNVELAFEAPLGGGRFGTLHYSISVLPKSTGYKPRVADARIGYFTTTHRDIGHPGKDTPWVRYINRWKLEKADPRLKKSPPKEPIVFYLEHTIPVRYRRWVREGVLEWNKAFERVGLVGAIEVYQQDARTGAHMEKDPEDARYDFVLWTNAGMGFAIGPSRVDPRTGQIIDADIVMDEGFITSWVNAWRKLIPQTAMINFGPQTLAWLQTRPQWDPRVILSTPAERPAVATQLTQTRSDQPFAGHAAAVADPTLMGDDPFDGLLGRVSQVNGRCEYASVAALELALVRLDPSLLTDRRLPGGGDSDGDEPAAEEETPPGQELDGIPEWFIGPLLKGVVMHEVGHTLGLRHNFKASCVYSLEEINTHAWKDKPMTGSVMDYTPVNIGFDIGETQGPYAMHTLGPYDEWAIEYGYTLERDLGPILARVAEPELLFGTDEDSWGSDPRARVFDLGRDPLAYAESQIRLVTSLRGDLLDRMVKKGESWAKARAGYELLLNRHFGAVSIAANWIGGALSNRDRKGDPDARVPVAPVDADSQRRALAFVIDNVFDSEAYGLTPELLSKMSVDKWFDDGGFASIFDDAAWPIHDRILGLQSVAMTMLMNPDTLNQVYDNEFRTPAADDALTLPELLSTIGENVWSEIEGAKTAKYTDRTPMIGSLRRNLQREHLDRLIDLMLPNPRLGVAAKPVATLATAELRALEKKIDRLLDRRASRLDAYSRAHLSETQVRITKALDAQYIYNADDIGGGGSAPFLLFGRE
ncbi:MAG: DUF5117 domain-containing protein [Phycisphaerales bacterium]|nr:DUF5117 domain-containing protein [Phycisphaerales bacterium]